MTISEKKQTKEKRLECIVNKMDAEIMEWFYECVEINFGTTMIQNSTDLREILRKNLKKLI